MKSGPEVAMTPANSLGLRCLNVGCGNHYLPDWTNVDLSAGPGWVRWDAREPLPFGNGLFDVVYSSHLIEHLYPPEAASLLSEAHRVLRCGGTVRIATPDLERMCREYLQNLEAWSRSGTDRDRRRYEWILLELFDQMTRRESGGMMLRAVCSGDVDRDYILERTGDELRACLDHQSGEGQPAGSASGAAPATPEAPARRRRVSLSRRLLGAWRADADDRMEPSGELHRWYYDRVSLQHRLAHAGFEGFGVVDWQTSGIPGWDRMNLDVSESGTGPRKPDSIVVEARKPSGRAGKDGI